VKLHRGPRRSTLVHWPESVDERLDALLGLVNDAGENASRAQLLAALVAAAPLDGAKLARQLRKYRVQDDTVFAEQQQELARTQRHRRPGPSRGAPRAGR